jgi:hypothetical protein
MCRSVSQPCMSNVNGEQNHNLEHAAGISSNLASCYSSGIPRLFFLFSASASGLCRVSHPHTHDVLTASGQNRPSYQFVISICQFQTEQVKVAAAAETLIWEALGSNLGTDSGYSGVPRSLQANPRGSFLPKPYQFITHQSRYHQTLVSQILSLYLWLHSPCGPWPLFQFLNPIYSR